MVFILNKIELNKYFALFRTSNVKVPTIVYIKLLKKKILKKDKIERNMHFYI